MIKQQALQDAFLNDLRKNSAPVSVYLVSGIRLQGKIESFDQFSIFLRSNIVQMIYKHAIATVIPLQQEGNLDKEPPPLPPKQASE